MSLINRVLQDLEARRAPLPADVPVPEQVRAVTAARPRSYRGPAVLLGLLVVVGVIAFSMTDNLPFIAKPKSSRPDLLPVQPARVAAQAPAETPDVSGSVQAQVEAALMTPVFQLSEELSIVPEARRAAVKTAAIASTASATEKSADVANKRVAAAAQRPGRQPEANAKAVSKGGEQSDAAHEAAVAAKPARRGTTVSKTGVAAEATAFDTAADEGLEQVVIPADVASGPIEKQARQLTAYERAENLFRLGVASLRRGRMTDAETQFRAAISEDRSHDAAQQALVGILIDAGRIEDAEAVLAESLSANPRQPKPAMILARLQVERGDLDMAIQTLESTKIYSGTDPVYLSFLAAVLQRADRHQEAVDQYRSALAFAPRNAIWLMGLGISLRALGNRGEALQVFDEAAAIGTLEPGLQAFVDQQRTQLGRAIN